ncbi:MAG TPA: nucleoside hydrolase [Acidimicrobiales bacterium]
MARPAIVLDCDPGLDDAVAILVAAKHTELLGITTVCGNSSVDNTTRNALHVLELANVDVPVHRGATTPLVAPFVGSRHIHGASGLGPVESMPARGADGDDAPGWLVELTRRRDDVHLVAVGPLTNVALAIRRDPGFVTRLAGLTIMGGAAATGNVTAVAEFNIWADPEAAAIVFGSGITVRMVPLDLTLQVRMTEHHVATLRDAATPTSSFVATLLEHYRRQQQTQGKESTGAVHDPCAVLSLTHPELFELHDHRVDVELAGSLTRGMTVVDRRARETDEPRNASVAWSADANRVLSLIVDAAISLT